ncbi:MAG: PAS domain-containing protein [Eubacteriales bacterium]|nr:PAS domain-containing protein [Eubacteriales bacterium]
MTQPTPLGNFEHIDNDQIHLILESSQIAIWDWNIQTGEASFNDKWAEMVGFTLAELQPMSIETWVKLAHPDDLIESNNRLNCHFSGETPCYEFESRMRHKDGHWVWVLDRGKVIAWTSDGQPLRMFGTHTDISRIKNAEAMLKLSEQRYSLALQGANIGLWDYDVPAKSLFFSPVMHKLLGYAEHEIPHRFDFWIDISHPDDKSKIHKATMAYLKSGVGQFEVEHRLIQKNGTYRWFLSRGSALMDAQNKPIRWIGTIMDITELTQEREDSLELERFMAVNQDLLLITDKDGQFIKYNEAWSEILGYPMDYFRIHRFLELIHPNDLTETLQVLSKLTNQEKVINFINRYRCQDGQYKYFEWRAFPYGDQVYGSARDITQRKTAEEQALYLSEHDSLTHLYNRNYFDRRVQAEIERANRYPVPLALVMIDLDHFKRINDTWGHPVGDSVLYETAQILLQNLRKQDVLVRMGGEEFLVLMPHTTQQGARVVAEKIRVAIEQVNHVVAGHFTASLGVAERQENESFIQWYKRVDDAMYQAKADGRNQVAVSNDFRSAQPMNVMLQWQVEWDCGNPLIDQQHQQLLDIGNGLITLALADSDPKVMLNLFDQLVIHLDHHFAIEEGILETQHYENLEAHRQTHRDLMGKARFLRTYFENRTITASSIFTFIIEDLVMGHLTKEDILYFPLLKGLNDA